MSFPAYPSYRESGIDRIGAVPGHWSVLPLKWLLAGNDGGVWGDDPDGVDETLVLRSTEQTVDGRWQIDDPASRKLSATERERAMLRVGDLLVTKSSGSALHIGKTTLIDAEVAELRACYSNFMQRLRPSGRIEPRLLWYLLNSEIARKQLDLLSNSSTGLANLNGSMLGLLDTPLPPDAEQTAIAAFLDRETAKIDALMDEQRQLIQLLKEKRQAVISHAVTKGLDPTAPMKDSGVEWLGQVPEHWRIVPVRSLFRFVKRQDCAQREVLSVYRDYGVIRKSDRDDNINKTPADLTAYQTVNVGDLVINKMKSWQGSLGVSAVSGIISPDYAVFEPLHSGNEPYFNQLFRCQLLPSVYRSISNGIRPDQWRLEPDRFKELLMPLPPAIEQSNIGKHVSTATDKIDGLVSVAEVSIALLHERRSALISATVTGKIDVRGATVQQAEAA